MICHVLTLLQTLLEIVFLRKGPDALPRLPVVLIMVIALLLLSDVVSLLNVESYTGRRFALNLILGVVGVFAFVAVLNIADFRHRTLQTISAIIGCGAILSFVAIFLSTVATSWYDAEVVQTTIGFVLLWSLCVEAHIISRAIERAWFVGFAAALAVLAIQLFLLAALEPIIDPKPVDAVTFSESV